MPLGFMTGERFYEGYDFDKWTDTLSGLSRTEVRWRPGGGFYADDYLKGLIGKSHQIGRQVSLLPDKVVSIQSEIENFPYQLLKKAAHTTVLEAASHIAAGCTGAAFNVLSQNDEPLGEYEPLVARLREKRPFFNLVARELGRAKPQGIYTGWNQDTFMANNISEGKWFSGDLAKFTGSHADEIFEIGLPVCYSLIYASVTVLSGDSVLAMKDEEILKILSSGVYLDAQALNCLNERGYEELTGFRVESFVENDCIEEFVNHRLNGDFTGRRRNCRQSFWKYAAGVLKPQSEKAEILARMVDYADKEIAPCGAGIFENRLGGRVCVAGYYPWTFLQNLSKSTQMKSLMRWLSRDTLPAHISSFHKVNLWVREPEKGRFVIVIINTCLDAAKNVTLSLRTDKKEVSMFDMHCTETKIPSSETNNRYSNFILPVISGWDMRLIVTR